MEDNYKVYMHIFPNNKVYIGITKRNPKYRWNNGKAYYHNQFMVRAIKKYGWDNIEHKILYENLTKEEAEQKEIELIKEYNSINDKYGYNIEKGGNHQGKINEESKNKMSKSHFGKTLPIETRKKISQTLKGTRHGVALYKMKPIDVYDENNNFIKHYNCMTDCQNEMGIKKQNISLCCKGLIEKTKGYKFKYSTE